MKLKINQNTVIAYKKLKKQIEMNFKCTDNIFVAIPASIGQKSSTFIPVKLIQIFVHSC